MKPPIVPSTTTRGPRPAPRTSRRRRPAAWAQHGPQPGSAAEELRKLIDAVADKVSSLQSPLLGMAAQGTVQQVIRQAKSAVEPVIERNPDLFDHLAAMRQRTPRRLPIRGRGPGRPLDPRHRGRRRLDGQYDKYPGTGEKGRRRPLGSA